MEGIGNHHWKNLETEKDWEDYFKYISYLPEEDLQELMKKQMEEIMEKLKKFAND